MNCKYFYVKHKCCLGEQSPFFVANILFIFSIIVISDGILLFYLNFYGFFLQSCFTFFSFSSLCSKICDVFRQKFYGFCFLLNNFVFCEVNLNKIHDTLEIGDEWFSFTSHVLSLFSGYCEFVSD